MSDARSLIPKFLLMCLLSAIGAWIPADIMTGAGEIRSSTFGLDKKTFVSYIDEP